MQKGRGGEGKDRGLWVVVREMEGGGRGSTEVLSYFLYPSRREKETHRETERNREEREY